MDTALLTLFELAGATVLSSLLLIIIFSLLFETDRFILMAVFTIIFLTIFSSLSPWLIVGGYLVLPGFLKFARERFLGKQSIFITYMLIFLTCLFFELILLLSAGEWNRAGFETLGWFVLLNSSFGLVLYAAAAKIMAVLKSGEIKF